MATFERYGEIAVSAAVDAVRVTFLQYLWFIVPLLLFGLLVHVLNNMTFRAVQSASLNIRGFELATGWIGVPVHEIGHAVFCVLFGHKIHKLMLFDPAAPPGEPLGYFRNSYDPTDATHVVGDFFVRIGPLPFGSLVLVTVFRLLVPDSSGLFEKIWSLGDHKCIEAPLLYAFGLEAHSLAEVVIRTAGILLSPSSFRTPQFWLFLYLAICVSCYLRLSHADVEPLRGIAWVVPIYMLQINTLFVVLELLSKTPWLSILGRISVSGYTRAILGYLSMMTAILAITATLTLAAFLICYAISAVYSLIRQQRMPNPFR